MITKIVKRDGRKVAFNIEKISTAIFKAAKEVGGNDYSMAEDLAQQVCDYLEQKVGKKIPTVEEVQDAVEYILIENSHATTAKAYILYRAERTKQREMNSEVMKMYENLTFNEDDTAMKEENSNVNIDTAMGTMLKYGAEGAKKFNKIMVLDKRKAKAHNDGDIYIHDLDFLLLTTNSCQIDIQKLFKNGFTSGEGFLREPNDISSYIALTCIVIQSNQNDQHGGQSIPNFDYAMADGVRKSYKKIFLNNIIKAIELLTEEVNAEETADIILKRVKYQNEVEPILDNSNNCLKYIQEELNNKFDKEISSKICKFIKRYSDKEIEKTTFQAMEALIHNLNTMSSRAGANVPFSSINYGTDTTAEGRLVIKNILLATECGLGDSSTPKYPVQIFKLKEGVNLNKEDPNYDLFKLSNKVLLNRSIPNYSFIDAPFNLKYYKQDNPNTEVAYMGARIRVMENVYDKNNKTPVSRGNLSITSINLPRIAILANKDINKFFILLDERMDLVIEQLMERYKMIAKRKVKNYPFLMGQGIWSGSDKLGKDDNIEDILKNGTLSVGFVGLSETLKLLTGYTHGESQESQNLGLKIIKYMRDRIDAERKITGFNYTLIANELESIKGRFIKLDKKKYGEIPGVTDKDSYTNSFEIPEDSKTGIYEKIKLESAYHEYTNGGHITNIFFDKNIQDVDGEIEKVIKYMKECGTGYCSIKCK